MHSSNQNIDTFGIKRDFGMEKSKNLLHNGLWNLPIANWNEKRIWTHTENWILSHRRCVTEGPSTICWLGPYTAWLAKYFIFCQERIEFVLYYCSWPTTILRIDQMALRANPRSYQRFTHRIVALRCYEAEDHYLALSNVRRIGSRTRLHTKGAS